MKREQWRDYAEGRVLVLDGATGSNLMKKGMPMGTCPEKWILEHPQTIKELQLSFIQAGSDIIYAPTFTCNRVKLSEYGLESQVASMNQKLVELSKEAIALAKENGIERDILVAGDLTMTGKQLYPMGDMELEDLIDVYKEQVKALVEAGVDLFVVETMMSLAECRAAVFAIKETCDLPIMVTLTFGEDGRTLYGTKPETAAVVLESLSVDAVGVNCSTGPKKMVPIIEAMAKYTSIPLIAKPNAGLPVLEHGVTIYKMNPQTFVEEMQYLFDAGASILGGCCGTTPEHIKQLADVFHEKAPVVRAKKKHRILTTEREILPIELDGSFLVVGERINPTGKKKLQAELREGSFELVRQMAEEQEEQGASILDINMGMNGIDEDERMQEAIYEVMKVSSLPISIDSSHVSVIEHALRLYPGRALINSISLESEKFEKLIPIAKKYGAMFVLLPLSDEGLPKDIEDKKRIIQTILDRAISVGMSKEDIIVDGLVATVGANPEAAKEALETIHYCKEELGVATICGLSNISFGLPERSFVNSTFLSFAIHEGLTMAIANPSQELLMNLAFASDLLLNKPNAANRYIERVSKHPLTVSQTGAEKQKTEVVAEKKEEKPLIFQDVLKGNTTGIVAHVKEELEKGGKPSEIVENLLIPAINETGALFEKQIYFLPQLISSAQAMKTAIDYLEPLLNQDGGKKKLATVVMATVEGDIHDIGKNLVVLMLKNYGFNVIDLGKDVPAEEIIRAAKENDAQIIGLSALMTTTMMEMKNVVELARKEQLKTMVIIGGAVTTQSFADEIGADGYSKDAQDAVELVKRLLAIGDEV